MVVFPLSLEYRPGTWKPLRSEGVVISATVTCPTCWNTQAIASHHIEVDGNVTPFFSCKEPNCPFFAHLRLADWEKQAGTVIGNI